eukprot:scaffold2408_cov386-Prasinococcus_capsulatus_cf.AAC.5
MSSRDEVVEEPNMASPSNGKVEDIVELVPFARMCAAKFTRPSCFRNSTRQLGSRSTTLRELTTGGIVLDPVSPLSLLASHSIRAARTASMAKGSPVSEGRRGRPNAVASDTHKHTRHADQSAPIPLAADNKRYIDTCN